MGSRTNIIERNKSIADEYDNGNGLTLEQLSQKYHFQIPYLRSILKYYGVVFPRKEKYSRSDQADLKERDDSIVSRFANGESAQSIADSLSLSKTRVLQILKERNAMVPKTVYLEEIQKLADRIRKDIRANIPYESVYRKEKFCETKTCRNKKICKPQSVYKCDSCQKKLTGRKNTLLIKGILDKYGKDAIIKCMKLKIFIFKEAKEFRINGVLQGLKNGEAPLDLAKKYHCTRDYIYHIKKVYGE